MKSLTIKSALLCAVLALSSCNSSSSSNGGGTPAPVPQGPGDVNVNQFDDNENSTTELSADDQAVALDALTDVGRTTYVSDKSQNANKPQTGETKNPQPKPMVAALIAKSNENEKPQAGEGKYFDGEALSQDIIQAVNNKQLCNPQITQKGPESKSNVIFTTSGPKCPMVIETVAFINSTNTEEVFDVSAAGTSKFVLNEQALPALKKQDLLSGDLTQKMNMKFKFPTKQSPDMTSSGSGEDTGKFISRKHGEIIASKKAIFATEMKGVMNDGNGSQSTMPTMIARSVIQVELRAAGKRAVFTVKMDSQATEPVKCTLNKKAISLEQCEEMINKLNLREQTQPVLKNGSSEGSSDQG